MPLKPIRDLVYIIPFQSKRTLGDSGLIIQPGTHNPRPTQGIVKYAGPACLSVKRGDHVYFSGYDGKSMVIEGEGELFVVEEEYIDAVDKGREDGDYLLTMDDVKRVLDKVIDDVLARLGTREGKEIAQNIRQNAHEVLESDFFERMYF